jgi:hypothetical protein
MITEVAIHITLAVSILVALSALPKYTKRP